MYNTIKTIIEIYNKYLTNEEILFLKKCLQEKKPEVEIEHYVKSLLKRIWDIELQSSMVISWLKDEKYLPKSLITFATISNRDKIYSFCNSSIGIVYDIDYSDIISANDKDGATIIESKDKKGKYTVYEFDDKIVNSYNNSSNIITPFQLLNSTKYNEMILDSKKVIPIGVVYLDSEVYDIASSIAQRLNLKLYTYKELCDEKISKITNVRYKN